MTTQPPSNQAVEAALAYTSINHKVDAMSEDVQRILWANLKPDCTGYSSAYALTAARILAAEVERLRAQADAVCEWRDITTKAGLIRYVPSCTALPMVYDDMPDFDFVPFCPGCGRKVKIQTQTDEQ